MNKNKKREIEGGNAKTTKKTHNTTKSGSQKKITSADYRHTGGSEK